MPTNKWQNSLDHREPTWKEGRNYQLVCGFDSKPNQRLCTVGENSSKSNRFVPWRTFGCCLPPQEPGDFCWFLNLETEEWEFTQWLGKRWYELTRKTCAEHHSGRKVICAIAGWNKGITNEPRGAFQPGFLWYNNGSHETRVAPEGVVPKGYSRGRLPRQRNEKGQYS